MIVAMSLKKIFEGKTIKVDNQDVNVQFHFGDQKEFNKWVASQMLSKKQKYPLIWYVISNIQPQEKDVLSVNTQLILFQGTNANIFNDKRYNTTYLKYLNPLSDLVNNTLKKNKYVKVLNEGKDFSYVDEPNYGVDASQSEKKDNDFTKKTKKGEKSITIDVVDARILNIKLEINAKCILNY